MKAAVVVGNCRLEIRDVPEPVLSNPTEIKIKVISGAVCNTTDNKVYATDTPEKSWPNHSFPFIIGHECVGRIVELGADVRDLKTGDKVVYWTTPGKAFADYLILDTAKSAVVKIADSVANDVAAIMEMVIGAARLLYAPGDPASGGPPAVPMIKEGDKVAVIGLGPAGLIYLRLARMLKAGTVCAIGRREFRLGKARELGADCVIDSDKPGYIESAIAAMGGNPDVIIDATGSDIVKEMIALGKSETKIIAYGVPPFNWKEKGAELTAAGMNPPQGFGLPSAKIAARNCVKWVESGESGLEGVISHRLTLAETGRALDMCRLERDSTAKIVISINEDN